MKNKDIVKKYFGDLDHFISDKGYPIVTQPQHKKLCELISALHIKDGRTQFKPLCSAKNIDPHLRADFWEYKYNEIDELYHKLYGKLDALVNS
ncbi:MAG TPA: hypothetical protein PKI14_01350 [Fervidobacterium sp.]|nr:hypothetical protein [Fervidobacterium sp.]